MPAMKEATPQAGASYPVRHETAALGVIEAAAQAPWIGVRIADHVPAVHPHDHHGCDKDRDDAEHALQRRFRDDGP